MKSAQVRQAGFGTTPLPEAAADDAVQNEGQDFPPVIATMPATGRQRTIAVGIVILLAVAAAVIAPFASTQVAPIDAFIPVLQTVLSVVDFITAILLFAQFSIQPQRALLALASGYIFSGSFAFLQTLAFPGAYWNFCKPASTAPRSRCGSVMNRSRRRRRTCTPTSPSRKLPWRSSSRTSAASEPASSRTTACSPSWRRSERPNYAEWNGAAVRAIDDATVTTARHTGPVRHSSAGGIDLPDERRRSASLAR